MGDSQAGEPRERGGPQEPDAPRKGTTSPKNGHILGRFPSNLAAHSRHLISRDNLLPFVIGTGAALVLAPADDDVAGHFLGSSRARAVDGSGGGIQTAALAGAGAATLWLAARASNSDHFRGMSRSLAEALALNLAITSSLKVATDRRRPDGENERSFPSGHASGSFTAAAVLNGYYGAKAGVPAYVVAGFVGATRVRNSRHFMSDVVAGATLGYIVGSTVTRRATKPGNRATWTPVVTRNRERSSITIHIHFADP